jgi:Ca2+-binding RTX toxin-like protein
MNINGTSGNDSLQGSSGDDTFRGGPGNDTLQGLGGFDTAVFDFSAFTTSSSFRSVVAYNGSADNVLQADGLGGIDTLFSIERFAISGGSAGDRFIGGGEQDLFEGGGGNDTLTGGGNDDTFAFAPAAGNLGTDRITDFQAGDRLLLRGLAVTSVTAGDGSAVAAGQVQLYTYWENDNVVTRVSAGADAQAGSDLRVMLVGDFAPAHFSIVNGSDGATLVYSPPADLAERILGTGGNDYLFGGGGDDYISGGANGDTLEGGAGNDTLSGGEGNDRLYGGEGNDFVLGSGGRDMLYGGDGNDLLSANREKFGNFEDSMLWGDAGNDQLQGAGGNDRLTGGDGDDLLIGAGGNDTMIGNAGADRFRFSWGTGNDTIEFFRPSHGDLIEIGQGVNDTIYSEADVMARLHQVGADTVLDLGAGNTVTLIGVQAAALTVDSFHVYSPSSPLPPDPPFY